MRHRAPRGFALCMQWAAETRSKYITPRGGWSKGHPPIVHTPEEELIYFDDVVVYASNDTRPEALDRLRAALKHLEGG